MKRLILLLFLAHNSLKEASPLKKGYGMLLCMIAAGMLLGGCAAGNASNTETTAAPIVTNSPMATMRASMAPMTSPDTSPAADAGQMGNMGNTENMDMNAPASSMTPAQAGRLAEQIAEAVERISEVDDAEVAIGDGRVLVAVEFDDQYSMGLDERMKKMIVDAVQNVDESLTDVEITDDDTLYGQVKGLAEKMAKATGLDELADDFGDLWNRITGM